MRRREVIAGLTAAWPLAARGQQQADRMRRIGVLMASAADDRIHRPALRDCCRVCSNWAGLTAETCGSTFAGPRPIPTRFANMRPNWLRPRLKSSWQLVPSL